jgi:hypothetical protein
MKKSTLIATALVLASLSLTVGAAPPGGTGGSRSGMPGAMPGAMSSHSDMPSSHAPDESSSGRSVNDLLAQNTKLASQIKDLTGASAQQACAGFRNLGECVAAAHVSKNLGIGFDALRSKMTGSGAESLGKAIQDLKPEANASAEARKAQGQAKADIRASAN